MATPAFTIKQPVNGVALEVDGSFFFSKMRSRSLQRFDAATRKVEALSDVAVYGPLALLDAERLISIDRQTDALVVLDRRGQVIARWAKLKQPGAQERTTDILQISPDRRWVAHLTAAPLESNTLSVFEVSSGRLVDSHKGVRGVGFADSGCLCFVTEPKVRRPPELIQRAAPGTAKQTTIPLEGLPHQVVGALLCAEAKVVSQNGTVISRENGHHQMLTEGWPDDAAFGDVWGWRTAPESVTWWNDDGTLKTVSLTGQIQASFPTLKARRFNRATTAGDWLVAVVGNTPDVELYDLSGQHQRSRPTRAKRKPVTSKVGKAGTAAELFDTFWSTRDYAFLSLWADALGELGDPRGEWIQLHLQDLESASPRFAKRRELKSRHGGKLVGPAREHLGLWSFADDGLVSSAVVKAKVLLGGFDEVARLNPRLQLRITALSQQSARALATKPLGRFAGLAFAANDLDDTLLKLLAPSLEGLRSLDLTTQNKVTAEGVKAVAKHVTTLETLKVDERLAPAVNTTRLRTALSHAN